MDTLQVAEDSVKEATDAPPSRPASSNALQNFISRKGLPSERDGVGDVPLLPDAQERFYGVHDRLVAAGAGRVATVDELEDEVELGELEDEERHAENEVRDYNISDSSSAQSSDVERNPIRNRSHVPPPESAPDSDAEVETLLTPTRATFLSFNATGLARSKADSMAGFASFAAAALLEGESERELEREHMEDDADLEENADDEEMGRQTRCPPAARTAARTARTSPAAQSPVHSSSPSSSSMVLAPVPVKRNELSPLIEFVSYWHDHVSKLYPPQVLLHYAAPELAEKPTPVASEASSTRIGAQLIGGTLTLILPDLTTCKLETPAIHGTSDDARLALFVQAWTSNVHETGRMLRDEIGWAKETEEAEAKAEELKNAPGGDQPWEALKAEGERWMAQAVAWEFETDELNSLHACILTVPLTPHPPAVFRTTATFVSRRDAQDAAARLAFEADIAKQYALAFKAQIGNGSRGYLRFGSTAKAVESEKEALEPVTLLHGEVKNAFGGVNRYLTWSHGHSPGPSPVHYHSAFDGDIDSPDFSADTPLLSASLTIVFPSTTAFPDPPAPFTASVALQYHTKAHARGACATLALREGLVERLKPYQTQRQMELVRRRAERDKREQERKEEKARTGKEMPKVGAVKYEDLDQLDSPATYLNQCIQVWTGHGSPLKFDYESVTNPSGPGKHYGCALHVYVNPYLTKTYNLAPSVSHTSRASAKEAAVRLALRERILDLCMPAGFDAERAAIERRTNKRARRHRTEGEMTSSADSASGAQKSPTKRTRTASPALAVSNQVNLGNADKPQSSKAVADLQSVSRLLQAGESAVAYLDQLILDRHGVKGALGKYSIQRDPSTRLFGATLDIPLSENAESTATCIIACKEQSRMAAQEAVAKIALEGGIAEQLPTIGPDEVLVRREQLSAEALRSAEEAGDTERSWEAFGGGDGEALVKLRSECAKWLGDNEEVLPQYKVVEQDTGFAATVTVTIMNATSLAPASTRAFGVAASFASRSLAADAAASAALSAGVIDLIASLARPTAPHLPKASTAAPWQSKKSKKQLSQVIVPARDSEAHAAARREAYGGFGCATAWMLERLLERARREKEAERKKEERDKVVRNPLLAVPVESQAKEKDTELFGLGVGSGSVGQGVSKGKGKAEEVGDTGSVEALRAYCLERGLAAPVFLRDFPFSTSASSGTRIWTSIGDKRFELAHVQVHDAEQRLAKKVLKHLQSESATVKA
ncbi:uncharacterized protein JCM10292_000456 [Rhodotorula paludigena]|uniref:uncharacterized protein n=1 Tax=Rhodotorula paludigena TaxID=86838 RepID=UPI00317251EA